MANIHLPRERLEGASKGGEFYDRCPHDGCIEVDQQHTSTGTGRQAAETNLEWSIFHADPRKGGCGANWSRTTRQGMAREERIGREPMLRTASAQTERVVSLPSEAYKRGYDRIDWSK